MSTRTRSNRQTRKFRPTVDGLENRQMLSTSPTVPAMWYAPPATPFVVGYGISSGTLTFPFHVNSSGNYVVDLKAKQAPVPGYIGLNAQGLAETTVDAVVAPQGGGTPLLNQILSTPSTSYVELKAAPVHLTAGQDLALYLPPGSGGGSEVGISSVRVIETTIDPVQPPMPTPNATFTSNWVINTWFPDQTSSTTDGGSSNSAETYNDAYGHYSQSQRTFTVPNNGNYVLSYDVSVSGDPTALGGNPFYDAGVGGHTSGGWTTILWSNQTQSGHISLALNNLQAGTTYFLYAAPGRGDAVLSNIQITPA